MLKMLDRNITALALKLNAIGAKVVEKWQYRFRFGVTLDGPSFGFVTYPSGEKVFYLSLLTVGSHGTKHWPWKLFEVKVVSGRFIIGHMCILGLLVGRSIKHDVDKETGQTLGPDSGYLYWAFSCINHQQQQLTEVI